MLMSQSDHTQSHKDNILSNQKKNANTTVPSRQQQGIKQDVFLNSIVAQSHNSVLSST